MRHMRFVRFVIAPLVLSTALLQPSFAQNLVSDARIVGLGGAGDANNSASRLVGDQQSYKAIPLPFGLIQVFKNRHFFDPNDPEFDPVRAIEYAADPMHITLKRNSSTAANAFVNNLVNGRIDRDLNTYRGFAPSQEIKATGLISPSFGKTIRVVGDKTSERSHGIYVGAGPYMSLGTALSFDPALIAIFASPTPVYSPNTTFQIGDITEGQGALAITGGYRGRVPLGAGLSKFGSGGSREGIYVSTDFHYLRGIHYDTADLVARFDTDSQGMVTLAPATVPLTVNRMTSKSGQGFAVDLATAIVTEHWDVGVGVDGIGNRINWKELRGHQYTLPSLADAALNPGGGVSFTTTSFTPASTDVRVSLPVRYSGNGGYHTNRWAAMAEVGRGLQGFGLSSGAEYYLGPLTLRGGGRYSRERWHGASGVGLTLFKGFGIDAAAFQTSTNIEENRRISFALSLRLGRVRD